MLETESLLNSRYNEITKNSSKSVKFNNIMESKPEELNNLLTNLMIKMKANADKEEYYEIYFDNLYHSLGLANLLNPLQEYNSKIFTYFR